MSTQVKIHQAQAHLAKRIEGAEADADPGGEQVVGPGPARQGDQLPVQVLMALLGVSLPSEYSAQARSG